MAKSAHVGKAEVSTLRVESALLPRKSSLTAAAADRLHTYGKDNKIICVTDTRGFENYKDRNPLEIRVDATNGFIPLWDRGVTLRYRFNESSFESYFEDPKAAQEVIKLWFGEAVNAWDDACPVAFTFAEDRADFEIVMMKSEDCNTSGCVLASAFFPDGGRHHLRIYPTLLKQDQNERVETLCHEIGHIFGLRHFFANVKEPGSPSRLFGADNERSIMNYGDKSVLTERDKSDLKKLYRMAWDHSLTEIDGAPIHLVTPFSSLPDSLQETTLAARSSQRNLRGDASGAIQILVAGRKISIE